MRILCVDDDVTMIKLYETVLAKHKQPDDEIFIAQSGEEGLARAAVDFPHLIITDLVMPGMDGIGVLKAAKEMNNLVEVIVVTGQGSIDSAVAAIKLGARDYLTKPINSGMLIEKITTIRELLRRTSEAEDYRIAKQTIESSVAVVLEQMEIKLNRTQTTIDEIETIVGQQGDGAERLAWIQKIIASFRKESVL